ncbi:MAG: hypothetical protein ABL957_03445 [Parvularculaceae bacterium]
MMNTALTLGLSAMCAVLVASGQALLWRFVNSVDLGAGVVAVVGAALKNEFVWGAAAIYAVGIGFYLALLRIASLAEATLTVMLCLIVCTVFYNHLLGDELSVVQSIGVACAVLGIIAINLG